VARSQGPRITAIPTHYAGLQFRSRLEARWACFFDQLGIRWDYEPIDLPGMIPDFVLPDLGFMLEVKPTYDVSELALRREDLHRRALPWIMEEREAALRALDADDSLHVSFTDAVLADIDLIKHGFDSVDGRRVAVVGSDLFTDPADDSCSLDGRLYVVTDNGRYALAPFDYDFPHAKSADVLLAWRRAQNATQWRPDRDGSAT